MQREPRAGIDPQLAFNEPRPFLARRDPVDICERPCSRDRAGVSKLVICRGEGNRGRRHGGGPRFGGQVTCNHLSLDGLVSFRLEHLVFGSAWLQQPANRS